MSEKILLRCEVPLHSALLSCLAMHQIERLIEIDRRVRAELRPRAADFIEAFEVSRRQIYLDRTKLIEMGAPLDRDPRGGWIYSAPNWVLPTQFLREGELLAFFLSVEIARSQGNAGLQAQLHNAALKIAKSLGDIVSVDLNTLRDSTSYSVSPAAHVDADFYAQLCRAIAHRRMLKMRYYTASSGRTGERVVHPYHLYMARGEWILIAHDESKAPDDHPIRCFNVARISRLEEVAGDAAHYQIAPDFDAKQYVREMFTAERGSQLHHVEIEFDEYQSRYIRERQWHSEQSIEKRADGGLTLRFPASGLQEVARWVMGYGRHAKVLAPDELREIVVAHITQLCESYNAGDGN